MLKPFPKGLGSGAGVRYLDSRYGDPGNTVKVPDVTLVDAALRAAVTEPTPEESAPLKRPILREGTLP